MSATEFRARCLGLIDEVAETGREIVIAKRGRVGAVSTQAGRAVWDLSGLDWDVQRLRARINAN